MRKILKSSKIVNVQSCQSVEENNDKRDTWYMQDSPSDRQFESSTFFLNLTSEGRQSSKISLVRYHDTLQQRFDGGRGTSWQLPDIPNGCPMHDGSWL